MQRIKAVGGWLRAELAVLVVASLLGSTIAQAEPQLPLPTHPGRQEVEPARTMPRAAQPGRGEQTDTSLLRTTSRLPIPGKPSRDLAAPGQSATGEADPEEEEEAPPPGLTNFLPHEWNGITAEYIYTGEIFSNAHGGISTRNATGYRGNFDLVLNLDTQGMGLWDGGRFFIYAEENHGKALSTRYVGDYQFFSNIDSFPRAELTQVSEYWYQHNFADDTYWFKLGKQDANANFAYIDLGGDFINSSFGFMPTIPLVSYPNPGLGVALFAQFNEHIQLAGGVYDAVPHGGQWGFSTLGENGYLSLLHLEIKTQWGTDEQLPNTVRVGAWHHSGDWNEITTDPEPRTFSQNYGAWTSVEQLIWKEPGEEGDAQGLGLFGQFGWAPGNRSPVSEYYGAGLTYRGLVSGRDQDLLGLGMANAIFGAQQQAVGGQSFETAVELFYKCYVNDYMTIQPDVQFIANPGGLYRDALVPGMRFEVVF